MTVCRGCGDEVGPYWGFCVDCLESGEFDDEVEEEAGRDATAA